MIEFNTYQQLRGGKEYISEHVYEKYNGRNGCVFYVKQDGNRADHILVWSPDTQFELGAQHQIMLADGSKELIVGAYHSNPNALLDHTGVDVHGTNKVRYIIALKRVSGMQYGAPDLYDDVIEHSQEGKLQRFGYTMQRAQDLANQLEKPVFYAQVTLSGSTIGCAKPSYLSKVAAELGESNA